MVGKGKPFFYISTFNSLVGCCVINSFPNPAKPQKKKESVQKVQYIVPLCGGIINPTIPTIVSLVV